MKDEADQVLLEQARAGDRHALESLLERHQAQVYRFGMKMCRDPDDAKDVVQDTLLAMARGVRDFRGASSLSTWLYTIARSFCVKKRRRSKFAPDQERSLETDSSPEAERVADPARGPEEALAGRQVEHALEQAIAELEPLYREVLLLRDVEGLTALLTMVSRHLEDEISAEACAEMERHLEACDRCRGACDSLRRTLARCRTSASAVEVPASVQDSVKVALCREQKAAGGAVDRRSWLRDLLGK